MDHKTRFVSAAILLMLIFEAIAACAPQSEARLQRSQDDAMLLMISSTARLLDGGDDAAGLLRPGMAPIIYSHRAQAGQTANEIGILVGIYENLYGRYAENLAMADPQLAEKFSDRLADEYQAKVEPLLARKAKLDARRRRRRWGLFRRIGRGLARFAKFVGRTTVTIVEQVGRDLARQAVSSIKARVRELFEGRVNTFIARIASKFGPLGPFVQDKLKAALDRWWIRTRDRVSGRLARQATQTARSGVALVEEPQTAQSEVEEVPIDESEFGGDECDTQGTWVEDYWDQYVVPALKQDHKFCSDASPYRSCLQDKAREGLCEEDAHQSCEAIYDAIPKNDSGGTITMTGQTIFLDAVENQVTITYPSGGGEVSGSIMFQRHNDIFGCTYTHTSSEFSGTYDPDTCTMQGAISRTMLYEGDVCVSVCGQAPSSPRPCPYSIPDSTTWKATLEEGILYGLVGDASCTQGCFEFRLPGYQ